MKNRRLTIVALFFVLAGIAANVPREWIYGVSPQERMSQVLSAFINLGSDPPESLVKADWLVRNERLRLLREKRLPHVPSALATVYANQLGLSEAAFRARLTDPVLSDPFETAQAALIMPQDAPHGQGKDLSWAYIRSVPPQDGTETTTNGCGLWLVFWDMDDWFYAPIGTDRAERLLAKGLAAQARVMLRDAPRC